MVLEGKSRPCSYDSPVFLAGDFFRQGSASTEKQNEARVLPGIALCQILVASEFLERLKYAESQLSEKTKGENFFFWPFGVCFPVLFPPCTSPHMNCVLPIPW